MAFPWGQLITNEPLPFTLLPGESKVVWDIQNQQRGGIFRIVAIGITEHPDTEYVYIIDGIAATKRIPLGSFIHPVYTCRDLGQYIEVDATIQVAVKNKGTITRTYAASLMYLETPTL